MRERRLDIAAVVALLIAYAALLAFTESRRPGPDPDRWFHYAISRQMAAQGPVIALPQADDLGWQKRYGEKEFLFHVLTTAGYKVAGERGALAVGWALGAAFLALLYALARSSGATPWAALALVSVLTLPTPYFFGRLTLLRPHLAGMVFFLVIVAGVLRRNPWLAAIGGLLFSLSYHAVYMPLALLAVAATVGRRERSHLRVAGAGLAGLAVALVANPYFPASVLGGFHQALIALRFGAGEPGMETGGELVPLQALFFLRAYLPCFVALAFAFSRRQGLRVFSITAAAFWVLSLRSPRCAEYAVPLSVLAAATAWPAFPIKRARLAMVGAVGVLLLSAYNLGAYLSVERDEYHGRVTQAVFAALETIPRAGDRSAPASGPKILNCDFLLGELILYARPDLRFVDLLDPNFLRISSPEKYEVLRRFKTGEEVDPYLAARATFNADYVLCARRDLNSRLDADPRFTPLYSDPASGVALFKVLANETAFVKAYETWRIVGSSEVNDDSISQRLPSSGAPVLGPYTDFFPSVGPEEFTSTHCQWARPMAGELKRLAGATVIGVGGGPNTRLWLNGRLVFRSPLYWPQPKILQTFARLPRPLRADDRLEGVVCRKLAPYWGFALSLWTERALADVCRARVSGASKLGRSETAPPDCLGRPR